MDVAESVQAALQNWGLRLLRRQELCGKEEALGCEASSGQILGPVTLSAAFSCGKGRLVSFACQRLVIPEGSGRHKLHVFGSRSSAFVVSTPACRTLRTSFFVS